MVYKWCVVSQCTNTSIKTPHKLFVSVPTNPERRKLWLQLSGRDPMTILTHTNVFMCEDHFNIEKDTINYTKYKMGFSRNILLADEAVPTKFYCQEDCKTRMSDGESSHEMFLKRENINLSTEYMQIQNSSEIYSKSLQDAEELSKAQNKDTTTEPIIAAENSVQVTAKKKSTIIKSSKTESCLICSGIYTLMVSLQECLRECNGLTVAQVLENLHVNIESIEKSFLQLNLYSLLIKIADAVDVNDKICFICVAKIHSCFKLKMLCDQLKYDQRFFIKEENHEESSIEESDEGNSIGSYGIEENFVEMEHKEYVNVPSALPVTNVFIKEPNFTSDLPVKIEVEETLHVKKEKPISTSKSFFCHICSKSYSTRNYFNKHQVIHSGEKPHVCGLCNAAFTDASNLRRHEIVHTGMKKHTCDVCNMSFGHSSTLAKHKTIHSDQKPYVCDICNRPFKRLSYLRTHKYVHSRLKPHVCDVCNLSFKSPCHLSRHKLMHKEPNVCDICDKSFSHPDYLNQHKLIHAENKTHVCDICNKSFTIARYLRQHKKTHINRRPWACDICDKKFKYPSELKKHKLTHSLKKRHDCDVCKKSFKVSTDLIDHKKICHTEKSEPT